MRMFNHMPAESAQAWQQPLGELPRQRTKAHGNRESPVTHLTANHEANNTDSWEDEALLTVPVTRRAQARITGARSLTFSAADDEFDEALK